MRRCKIVTWILILSIVNFALGAPTVVQERLVTSVDVDVAEGGTATSQKRYDPLDDWSTSNTADRPPSPARLTSSDLDRLWEGVAEQRIDRYSPPTPESPMSSASESVDSTMTSNPGAHSDPTGGSPLRHPGPSEYRFLSPPIGSVNPDTSSSTDLWSQIMQLVDKEHHGTDGPPPSLGSPVSLPGSNYVPPSPVLPTGSRLPVGSIPLVGYPSSRPPPFPYPSRPPSEDGLPGFSVNPDTLSSTGHQPMPLQSPTGGSPLPHPLAGPSDDRFPSPPRFSANTDTLPSTDLWSQIMQQVEEEHHTYADGPPPSLNSPVSLPGSDYVPPHLESPTGPRLSVGSMSLAGSPSPRPPPLPYPSQPGPSEGRFLPGFSVNPDDSDTLSTGHKPIPPQSPTGGSPLPHPGPSEVHFSNPPGFSVNPDTLPSTGKQLTSQSPGLDQEMHYLLYPEHFPTELWDKLLKGKIRRRISGPSTVNSAQRDPRSTNIST